MGGQGNNSYTEPLFQGRDKYVDEIKNQISDKGGQQGSDKNKVIAIYGIGGIGKTSLAKHVYQHQFDNVTFDQRAFVTMNQRYNVEDLKDQLIAQLTKKTDPNASDVPSRGKKEKDVTTNLKGWVVASREEKNKKLFDSLKEKKYLVVLDDLSTTSEAEAVDKLLGDISAAEPKVCWIIVTTREEEIARRFSKNGYIIELERLEPDDAWKLFTEMVFKKRMGHQEFKVQYPVLAEDAAFVINKCEGLPIAICTIGRFLADQPQPTSPSVWASLRRHIRHELDRNPQFDQVIRNVLSKSFVDGLPHHLKYCFLYMSIFPEGHHISRRRLVRRWIAEGYSSEGHSESQEVIADRNFTQLISRRMLFPSRRSVRSRKTTDSCQVHNSILRSTEENLVLSLENGGSGHSSMQGKPRHLVISSNWTGVQSQFEKTVDPSGIRSLTVFGKWRAFALSKKMRFLRVLDLEDTSGLVQHHLEHIGEFLHMKYLSLRGCRGIYYLPDSIGNLKQLQTLDITDTSIIKLPQAIIKLVKLQYLQAWAKYQPKRYDVSESCAACCAPEIMGDVLKSSGNYFRCDVCTFCCCLMLPGAYARIKGRKLAAPGVAVPRGVRRLRALHTLGAVNLAADKGILLDIRKLTRLRKLAVTNVSNKNWQILHETLGRLDKLESLYLKSSDEDQELDHGNHLYKSPPSLESLKLVGPKLFDLVNWQTDAKLMVNLVKLKIKFTNIETSDATTTMKHLGELPKLKFLRLLRGSFTWGLKLKFPADGAFPSLNVLEVDRINGLKLVEFVEGSAPQLELLQYTKHSTQGPDTTDLFSGLKFLKKLKEFLLYGNGYDAKFIENVEQQLKESARSEKPAELKRC